MFLMGGHSLAVTLSALLARYPTDIRISCGALDTPPARCALLQHDINDAHQPVMLFRLTRTSREPLSLSTAFPFCRHHSLLPPTPPSAPPKESLPISAITLQRPARDKPQALSPAHSLHSAPAARHPSRGVRRLCSHRATKDMGMPPILAHPHTTQSTLVQRHPHPCRYIERPAERGCAAPAEVRLLGLDSLQKYGLQRVLHA